MNRVPEIFLSEVFGELRIIEENNKFYFCAVDVCKALGYTNITRELNIHCRQDGISPAALRLAAFPALSSSSQKGMYTDSSAAPISLRLNSSRRGFSMNCCPRFVRPADM